MGGSIMMCFFMYLVVFIGTVITCIHLSAMLMWVFELEPFKTLLTT